MEDQKADHDKARLSQLGYKQELKRHLTMLENFAFSFSIISVMTGITTTYNTGLRYGGPVSATLGWLLVSLLNGCVAFCMAEICSAYPTAGGLYYWSAKLAGRRWAPLASWITGWFNIVGQWAETVRVLEASRVIVKFGTTSTLPPAGVFIGTTSVDFSLAQMLQVITLLSTGGANGGGYLASKYVVLGCYAAFLIIHGIINSISVKWVSFFCQLGAIWNVIGVFLLTILIPAVATEKASPKFVFSHFNSENDAGIHNKFYIFVLGLLMSQYSMAGYDTSVHMTEETKNADINGPKGIINSVAISSIVGYIYLISITFTVRDIPYLLRSNNDAGGYAIAEVFFLVFKNRYGSGVGGIICLGFVAIAVFFCGLSAVASNSRMTYAFARDGALPFSSFWCRVNKEEVPANAVWLALAVSFCMALTSLGSLVAFQAMVSIATIGLYIAYALPIFFRVTLGRQSFVPGPFSHGRWSIFCSWVAVIWVATITVLFSLPVAYPIKKDTLNYAPIAVGGVFILVLASWVFSARHWFRGPISNIQT